MLAFLLFCSHPPARYVPTISVLVSMARAMTCAVSVLPTPVGPVKAGCACGCRFVQSVAAATVGVHMMLCFEKRTEDERVGLLPHQVHLPVAQPRRDHVQRPVCGFGLVASDGKVNLSNTAARP